MSRGQGARQCRCTSSAWISYNCARTALFICGLTRNKSSARAARANLNFHGARTALCSRESQGVSYPALRADNTPVMLMKATAERASEHATARSSECCLASMTAREVHYGERAVCA